MKNNKGITLVALIITIVVLLILAVVSIKSIQNDGIIKYAQNASGDYKKSRDNEITTLEKYTTYAQELNWGEEISFKIGPYLPGPPEKTLTAREGMTWRQWIESEYYDNEYIPVRIYRGSGYSGYGFLYNNDPSYTLFVTPDAKIEAQNLYKLTAANNYSIVNGW